MRLPANKKGGRSRRPILIIIQLEPHSTQQARYAARMRSTGVVSPGDAQSRREPGRRRAAGQLPDEEGVVVCRRVEAFVAARAAAVTCRVNVYFEEERVGVELVG